MTLMQSATDIPLHICSEETSSERRISPAWTIARFKARLEPITGIPSTSQRLLLSLGGSQPPFTIEAADEDQVRLSTFPLQPYAEIHVSPELSFRLFISRTIIPGPPQQICTSNGNFGSPKNVRCETLACAWVTCDRNDMSCAI